MHHSSSRFALLPHVFIIFAQNIGIQFGVEANTFGQFVLGSYTNNSQSGKFFLNSDTRSKYSPKFGSYLAQLRNTTAWNPKRHQCADNFKTKCLSFRVHCKCKNVADLKNGRLVTSRASYSLDDESQFYCSRGFIVGGFEKATVHCQQSKLAPDLATWRFKNFPQAEGCVEGSI